MLPAGLRSASFRDFFESGGDLATSPFLRAQGAGIWRNLDLKIALTASGCLVMAFIASLMGRASLAHLLLTFVFFSVGTPAIIASVRDLLARRLEIDILMSVAAFASAAMGHPLEGGLLLVLFALSRAIETVVTARARSSLSGLRQIAPRSAHVWASESFVERHIAEIAIGDRLLIKAGEIVPLDGEVLEGTSSVVVAHLTGESGSVPKGPGDSLASGSQNGQGALQMRVTRTSGDSTLFRLIELVTKAHAAKPKLQHLFERFESAYAKAIFALSLSLALLPWLMQWLPLREAGYRATCLLIAASPCALILALPIAYMCGVSACARRGIVLKGGHVLDALLRCRCLVFDKTGTLTADRLEVGEVSAWSLRNGEIVSMPPKELTERFTAAIATAENNVVHPIASAIASWCQQTARGQMPKSDLAGFCSHSGLGASAHLAGGEALRVGRPDWVAQILSPPAADALEAASKHLRERGGLVAAAAAGSEVVLFALHEQLREGVAAALSALRAQGLTLRMLTGDREENAHRVAAELGIDEVWAELSPEDKLQRIQKGAESLAMIGDGVNDAPALAAASVGIAMGRGGSALAVEAADIVLLENRLEHIAWLIGKARATRRIVWQNLGLALAAIVVASISSTLGWIPLAAAVCAHEGGTVIVGLNGLRLLR